MKKVLLFSCLFFAASTLFSQPFTRSNQLWIPVTGASASGLFIQGQTGVNGSMTFEANGVDQVFWITGASNLFKIGGAGGSEPAIGAINIDGSGHVGIGTINTSGFNFNVAGTAVFDGITVKNFSGNRPNATPWADYVFDKNYQLPSLESVASFIRENKHLPGIPTTAEVEKNGLDLAANQVKLLEKVEQLTLYVIELQKQVDQLKAAKSQK
jgi:hypothetical protein